MANSPIVNNKSLSIRVCSNGLSFCTYSPTDDEPFCQKEWKTNHTISLAANLKNALVSEEMLKESYQRVNVIVTTPHFTIVPVAMFNKEQAADIYRQVFPNDSPRHVSYNVLRRSGIAIVFGLDRNIYNMLLDDFPRARFYASASTLIEHFGEKSHMGPGKKMYLYIHEKEMTLYVFDRGRLLYANNFSATATADLQYYLLNVWTELGLSQTDDSLNIVGDNEQRCSELADSVTYFLQNVTVIDHYEDFKNKITSGRTSFPYDLQTLLVCGF